MRKFFLIIADTDDEYVERLSSFIMNNYANRFKLICFTDPSRFREFLSHNKDQTYIIAATPLFFENVHEDFINFTKVILSEGNVPIISDDNCYTLNKYQHGDHIVRYIISIIDDKDNSSSTALSGNKKTKTAFVYSPAGGTGKTTFSLCLSILCAREGLSIFLLSLEYLSSLLLYLNDSNNNNTLSNILYYIEENHSDISLKIESLRSVDSYYGIHFFSPPECDLEILQSNITVIESLINGIKNLGFYDVIFVDMPSSFGITHAKTFYMADILFCIIHDDPVCLHKYKRWQNQISLLLKDDDIIQPGNISVILNKYNGKEPDTNEIPYINPDFILPAFDNIQNSISISSLTSPSNPFGNSILNIVKKFFLRGATHEQKH